VNVAAKPAFANASRVGVVTAAEPDIGWPWRNVSIRMTEPLLDERENKNAGALGRECSIPASAEIFLPALGQETFGGSYMGCGFLRIGRE
jgi:hypothetical protein